MAPVLGTSNTQCIPPSYEPSILVILPTRCAWCLSEQGIPAGEGSHGICKKHANRLLLQRRKLHSHRVGGHA
jgi:hypothetical protein